MHTESGYIRNAQIDIGQSFISVDARVLPQPNLQAGHGTQIDVRVIYRVIAWWITVCSGGMRIEGSKKKVPGI
jgi:hypothetical protein